MGWPRPKASGGRGCPTSRGPEASQPLHAPSCRTNPTRRRSAPPPATAPAGCGVEGAVGRSPLRLSLAPQLSRRARRWESRRHRAETRAARLACSPRTGSDSRPRASRSPEDARPDRHPHPQRARSLAQSQCLPPRAVPQHVPGAQPRLPTTALAHGPAAAQCRPVQKPNRRHQGETP